MKVVDLFAGPGGWDQGLADLGFTGTVVGLEWDAAACDTAMAAGHLRVQADVATYPTGPFVGFDGLIASPPCQAFSTAGKGAGLGAVEAMVEHVWHCRNGWDDPPSSLCAEDVRADLTLQPLRWADALRPDWIALEQVPGVLPLWKAIAAVLERWGYSTAVAVLSSEQYGVPQVRKRAILMASRGAVSLPDPTHTAYNPRLADGGRHPEPSLFGEPLSPWVSMADGLSWPDDYELDRRTNSRAAGGGSEPTVTVPTSRPAPTVTGQAGSQWVARPGWGYTDRPAPTIIAGPNGKSTGAEWGGSSVREGMYEAQGTPEWAHKRPATTVVGSFCPDVIAAPGYRTQVSRQNAPDSIRVSVAEAGVLQSFPADYPWQGSKTKRHEQVGNAIPPMLAAAVLRPLVVDALEVAA